MTTASSTTVTKSTVNPFTHMVTPNGKPRLATAWLDGCSGCHMSLLDMDERLIEIAQKVQVVYSPTVDLKHYPDDVDVALVEGAVSSEDDLHKIEVIRSRTKFLVSLGDCAVTGNVPSMRNNFEIPELLDRAFVENANVKSKGLPILGVPKLLPKARPIHEIVKVDLWVPGCPPPADAIYHVISELLAGRTPDPIKLTRFGK